MIGSQHRQPKISIKEFENLGTCTPPIVAIFYILLTWRKEIHQVVQLSQTRR